MGFSERLKGIRCAQELTQHELGRMTGVSQCLISAYERGERQPHARSLHRLAEFFGVSAAWLSGDVEDLTADTPPEKEPEPVDDGWLRDMIEDETQKSRMALPQKLKKLREEAGVSLGGVEKLTGVHAQSILSYEHGTMYPGFLSLVRLAEYYGVSLDYLAGREN